MDVLPFCLDGHQPFFIFNHYCSRPKRLETTYFSKAKYSRISVITVKTCDIINVAFIGLLL